MDAKKAIIGFIIVVGLIAGVVIYLLNGGPVAGKDQPLEIKEENAAKTNKTDVSAVEKDVLPEILAYIEKDKKLKTHYVDMYIAQAEGLQVTLGFAPGSLDKIKAETTKLMEVFKEQKIVLTEITHGNSDLNDLAAKLSTKVPELGKEDVQITKIHTDMVAQKITVTLKGNKSSEKAIKQKIAKLIKIKEETLVLEFVQ